jgi:predicted nucleic acid-binding protein
MTRAELLFDSSALVVGIISSTGGARALLVLSETSLISIVMPEQVVAETERAIARKVPRALGAYRRAVRLAIDRIQQDPSLKEIKENRHIIQHETDVPIVVAVMQARVDLLVTLSRRHFFDDQQVTERSGLQIDMPGYALDWLREAEILTDRT